MQQIGTLSFESLQAKVEARMSTESKDQSNVHPEFERLGKNLRTAFQAAWDSEGRKELHTEIENGLRDVGHVLRDLTDEFSQSETGQQIRADVEDLQSRVHSGEFRDKAKQEFCSMLDLINRELEQFTEQRQATDQEATDNS